MKLLIFARSIDGKPDKMTTELMGLAGRLAKTLNGEIHTVLLGENPAAGSTPDQLIHLGAQKVHLFPYGVLDSYQIDYYAEVMNHLIKETEADLVLLGHDMIGRELAPKLALRIGTGCCTDCLNVEYDEQGDRFVGLHPVYGGNAIKFLTVKKRPFVFTIRSRCQEPAEIDETRTGEIIRVELSLDQVRPGTSLVSCTELEDTETRLEDARVIIAGGRGLGGADGFNVLRELAELLGGAVGASRAAVDAGWIEAERQIGLTGKFVSPQLYIAVGISGAPQHMTGCANAKTIVCVNSNPEAAIFKRAHYGIVGDFRLVIPKIIPEFQKILNN